MHTVQDPGRVASGVLALTVHAVFFALLVVGVSWQKKIVVPVMVDLWEELPELEPKPEVPPPVKAAPEVKKTPLPEPKKAPPPAPIKQVVPPKPSTADIELKEKQRLQQEEQARQMEERQQAEAEKRRLDEEKQRQEEDKHRQEEEKRYAEDAKRRADAELKHLEKEREREAAELVRQAELKRLEDQRRADELKREQERKELAAAMERERVQKEAARKQREADEAKIRAEAERRAAHNKLIETHMARIRAKVLPRIRVPDDMKGKPEGMFEVTVLPGGDVLEARLLHSSGVSAYDLAVERAIIGASPLPVPGDPDLFQQEFRKFKFSFKPDS